jgi:hypothetical protein
MGAPDGDSGQFAGAAAPQHAIGQRWQEWVAAAGHGSCGSDM